MTKGYEGTISVFEFFEMIPDEEAAIEYMENIRWEDGVCCPRCESRYTTRLKAKPYHLCRICRRKFTVRTDSIFERSHIPLNKWLYAMYMLETARKGISSLQLAKELGISQKSCWFMLHRLREACDVEAVRLGGEVEVDETFVGGSLRRMQYGKKLEKGITHWKDNKTTVIGMRQRDNGRVVAYPVEEESVVLSGEVLRNVERGSTIYTDTSNDYHALNKWYQHESVVHSRNNWREGDAYTNGIESVWAVIKRGYKGVYHWWSEKHMERYINEFAFRLNEGNVRHHTLDRINELLRNSFGKRLTWEQLVSD